MNERLVQISQFFCEEARIEEGGKPFIIGILSPAVLGPPGVDFPSLTVATSVYVPNHIEEIHAQLHLVFDIDGETSTSSFQQTIPHQRQIDTEDWMTFLPLLVERRLKVGDTVTARFECHGQTATSKIKFVPQPDAVEG